MSVSSMALELHRAHVARIQKWERKAVPERRPEPEKPPVQPWWVTTIAAGMVVPNCSDGIVPSPAALGLIQSNKEPHVIDIQKAVCVYFNLPMRDLLSVRRDGRIVTPRQIAMYLSRMLTARSMPDIGRRFGGRDHTTVLHAVRKIGQLYQEDDQLRQTIDNLKERL